MATMATKASGIQLAPMRMGDLLPKAPTSATVDKAPKAGYVPPHMRSGGGGTSQIPDTTPISAVLVDSEFPTFGSATKAASTMRFLVPGNISANVHVTIFSGGGIITPVGFDSLTIPRQRVVDVPLPKISLSTPYGIEVTSDQPIFASALTKKISGGLDFAWANQLTPLSNFKINLAGAAGQFFFMGRTVAIKAQWIDSKGKANSTVISGDASAPWHPSGSLNQITFTPLTKEAMYGGALISNSDGGLNYLPLLANQLIARGELPIADLRTLTRH